MGKTKITISKKGLWELYWKENLSTAEIAKKYHCTHSAVIYKMQSFGIKRRTKLGLRKPVKINIEKIKKLYLTEKLSEIRIAKMLGCSRGSVEKRMRLFGVNPRSYSESNTRYPKKNFSGNLIEKAYLIGFRIGDLNISRRHYLIRVACSSTIEAQVDLIRNIFSPYSFVYTKPSRILNGKQVIDIQCLLNESFNFLLPKQDSIESWILNNSKLFFPFLAGYIDAEGHIYTRLQHKTPFSGIEIGTYDKNILHQIWKKLNQEGVNCPKPIMNRSAGHIQKNGLRNNKDCWKLSISRKLSLIILFKKLKPLIKHAKRKDNLNTAYENVLSRVVNIPKEN